MLTLLAALLTSPTGIILSAGVPSAESAHRSPAATLRITLNGGDYRPGDRVRVQVEPGQDGYLIVFRVDGDSRVRVLFPIDPDVDAFVRGGKRYELRGRNDRESFLADDIGGNGLIYAALSREPLVFGSYAVNDHWDYESLRLPDQDSDAEAALGGIVRRMSNNSRFDYDVTGYRVHEQRTVVTDGGRGYSDPFYDPYWNCLSCGYRYGGGSRVNIGFGSGYGWNDPWYRDPWYYDPFAYNSYYGYYGYPYAGSGWNYPGQYRPYVQVNLPRPRVPDTPYGFRARERRPNAGTSLIAPDLARAMRPDPRPSAGTRNGNPVERGSSNDRGRVRNDDGSRGRASSGGDRRDSPPPAPSSPPSARPAPSSSPNSGGSGTDSRARRRPEVAARYLTPGSFEVPVERRQYQGGQPIFREPRREAMVERSRPEPQQERPVFREPPRVERSSPPPQSVPRYERPASAPPPAAAPAQGSDRARRRPG